MRLGNMRALRRLHGSDGDSGSDGPQRGAVGGAIAVVVWGVGTLITDRNVGVGVETSMSIIIYMGKRLL